MDPDVVEIPPPIHRSSRLMKQKQAILHDVIDIDNDDDESADLVIIGEKVGKSNKGKTIEAVHDGYSDHQVVEVSDYTFFQPDLENFGAVSGIGSSNGYPSVSHNLINVDGHCSDQSYDDDDYIDMFTEDYMDVDEYALLQAHFDNVDIPPGIEAPFTWLPEYDLGLNKAGNSTSYPWCPTQSDAKNSQVSASSKPSWSLEPTNSKIQGSSAGSPNLQIKMDNVHHSSGTELSSPQLFSQSAPSKKKSSTSQRRGRDLNLSLGVESSKSHWFLGPFQSKKKPATAGASANHGFVDNSEALKLPNAGQPPYSRQFKSAKKPGGSSSSYQSNFIGHHGLLHPPGIESENPWWKNSHNFKPLINNHTANPIYYPFDPLHAPPEQVFDNTWVHTSARDGNNRTAVDTPLVNISDEVKDEILKKFRSFKKFDTVEDTSDHYFIRNNSKQNPKNWAKKIQEEWKILEKDLPDSIFVRVYESRMDLLRAVIIGAEGTPYHDGLFFFDVFFPSGYPNVPPQVHYHSGGLRLNPNLYNCGKVCLSLLNTWSGNKNEKWLPGVSTILQVLVSIQGLILNTKPYFNEPGYAHMSGSANGEMKSLQYNEDTFILSLRTMMYMIRRPPKNFEDFVLGHFCSLARDILVACKAYMEGAQVGCLVKGGVQDVDEGDRSCSKRFKESLTGYVNMLAREFAQIGAKNCETFMSPATTVNKLKIS
ncbi:probable ubiquitin-conjugating enzyme E2 26 [Gastrolobium bilobum]|uniref:probable ubiquitin-conjugating enzyme E2 26 n=1 Tax=Gastrolobium bilobum TaxID=150636 RepID=UPI002AB08AF4|nr:probable ubiquitin-conjugating enzyme E2 26 [Gastrolobium bilobum]XP_061360991.1 probable ubiquitin-conjugating enzyme E2 26 [Gastrolobium bilobum]